MENSRPPLLDALASLKPNILYTMATPKELSAAANAFSQGAVKNFRWGGSGLLLEAVLGTGEDAPAVRFTSSENRLQFVCDCGAHGACKHVLASVMTITRALHDAKFGGTDISPTMLAKFRFQLRADAMEKPKPRVIFSRQSGRAAYEIDYDSGRREASWRVSDPLPGMEWLRWQDQQPERVAEGFCAWLKTKPDVEFEIQAPDRTFNLAKTRPLTLRGETRLSVLGEAVKIRRDVIGEDGAPVEAFLDLGNELVVLEGTGAFARIHPREGWGEFSRLGSARGADGAISVPVDEFNAGRIIKPDGPCTLVNQAVKPVESELRQPRPAIHVQTGTNSAFVAIRAVDGPVVPIHSAFARVVEQLSADGPHALLVKTPGRRRRVVEILTQTLAAAGDSARAAILEEVPKDPTFVSPAMHGDDARKCLDHLLQSLRGLDEDTLLASPEGGENPWMRCRGGGTALGRALAIVAEAFPDAEILRSRDLVVSVSADEFSPGLRRLLAACEAQGVELRVDEGVARLEKLSISVRAQRSEILDWFELHPEARAGALKIPRSQWDEILRRGRYRAEDGTLVALDDESLALLKSVSGLLEGGDSRLPRLRIFDWLALKAEGLECELPAEDGEVLQSLQTLEGIPSLPRPAGLQAELREYQQHGYEWLAFLYRHRFGACLADDMGLGKTLQAIALLVALKDGEVPRQSTAPHLLVLPPTLLFNWQSEIARFAPGLKVHEYTGQGRSKDFGKADVVMTTYELARRDIETLAKTEFDLAIFDEAQAVKNFAAARTQAIMQLRAKFRLCLTGTPLENHVGEFHSIMETAVPGLFGDRRDFLRQHEAGRPILRRARPFLLRRTKEKILAELPPKVETDLFFPLSAAQKEFYTRAVGDVRREVLSAYEDRPAQQAGIVALAALTRLRQICISPALLTKAPELDSPKIEHLVEHLTELQEEGHAALVFSQFVKALDLVSGALTAAGLAHLRLDGSTPTAKRKELVASFQSGEGPGIFLISLKTGGAGLNLTRASYVYHLDPWWNPAVERQAGDRAHRLGQKNSVYVQRLLMRHTVEEKMMALKDRKRAVFEAVVEQGQAAAPTGAAGLTAEDFQFLVTE